MPDIFDSIHAQANGAVATLDPSEVEEDSTRPVSLNPSEVEIVGQTTAQPASPSIDYQHPAGAPGGTAPGVPLPQVAMQPVPSGARAVIDAIGNADSRGMQSQTVTGPDGKPTTLLMPDYGRSGVNDLIKGSDEFMIPGQGVQSATDLLRGANEGMSSSILPLGAAPGSVALGMAGSTAGSYAAPKVVKALGGNQQQQDLAREAGAALPLAAGVGADLIRGGVGTAEPEILPPSRVTGIYQEATAPRALPAPESGQTPLLESGEGPAFSQQPAPQAPPPLNEAESRTRIVPTQAAPNPVLAPPRGMVVDEQGNIVPAPAGLLPGHAPAGADLAQSEEFQGYLAQHPAGKVTGIDQQTGLPIVDRTQPPETLSAQGGNLPPQTGTAGPMSAEAEAISAQAARAAQKTAQSPAIQPEIQQATNQPQPVGARDPESGRVITQPSDNPAVNQALATTEMPAFRAGLQSAIQDIPGADLVASRSAKNPSRLAEKIGEENQPPETVNDYGAAQIAVDSPQAKDAAIAAVRKQFPVLRVQDNFQDGDPQYGYRSYSMQIQMPNGSSQELQIVPREVHEANADEHVQYKEARNAQIQGQDATALVAKAKAQNDAAMEQFNARNTQENLDTTVKNSEPPKETSTNVALTKGAPVLLPDGRPATVDFYDRNLTKNARVTAADGERISSIPGKSLTPIAPVSLARTITGSPVETEAKDLVAKEGPAIVSRYLKANQVNGVPYIGTDNAKELFPVYRKDRLRYSNEVQAPASAVADAAFRTELSRPVDPKRPYVTVLTGAPASGKTSGIIVSKAKSVAMYAERIIDDSRSGSITIDRILSSGRKPEVVLVYTGKPQDLVPRMVNRAREIGRTVQLEYMAKSYVNAPRAIEELRRKYGDNLSVVTVDNSTRQPKVYNGTVEPALTATGKYTEAQAREAMHEELERLRNAGEVPNDIYNEAIRKSSAAEGARPDDGRGVGQRNGGSGENGQSLPLEKPESSPHETENPVRPTEESSGGSSLARESKGAEESSERPGSKPEHEAAIQRSIPENLKAVSHEVIQTPHGNAISASNDGIVLLDKFLGHPQVSNALTLLPEGVEGVVKSLRAFAATRPEHAESLTALADSLIANRTASGNAIVIRAGSPNREMTLREEFFHDWQMAHGLLSSDLRSRLSGHGHLRLPGLWRTAKNTLTDRYGYGGNAASIEVPAWIAAGKYNELGLTLQQAGAVLKAYLGRAAEIQGAEILDSLPEIDPAIAKEIGYERPTRTSSGESTERAQPGTESSRGGSGKNASGGDEEGQHSLEPSESSLQSIADTFRNYLRQESELIRASREIHSGLEDLDPQYDADVLRANKLMDSLLGSPADQEQVYHHLEDPSIALTKTQRSILDQLNPLEKQSADIFRKLYPERGYAANYVHRIAQQKGSLLDRVLNGSKSTGKGNLLKKNAAAGKKRSMMALESPAGERQVVSIGRGRVTAWRDNVPTDIGPLRAGMTNPDEILDERLAPLEREESKLKQEQRVLNETPSRQAAAGRRLQNIANRLQEVESERSAIEHQHIAENLPDKAWRDKEGNLWSFKQATTKEIERDTPVEYYKNAAASVVTNWLELRKAERANDYLEDLKQSPEFQRLAIKPSNPGQIPEGWRSTQLPQLMGYYFEPHVAEVFDQYAKELAKGEPGVFEKVNSFLTTSIFLNPIAHIPNLTANWLTEKGISPLDVRRWGPEFKAGVRAFNAVVHQNQDFLDALDAGAPMQSQKREVQEFSQVLLRRLQKEAQSPDVIERLHAALGRAINIPAAMKYFVEWMSSKATWPVHDLYFMQSAYLKMEERGISLAQALKDTATYIPDERLPTRVFNSKALGDLLRSPALMFTRYHYGVLKGWGKILQNLSGLGFSEAAQNPRGAPINAAGRTLGEEKMRALNIAAGLALMLTVVYPEIDKLLKKATGNQDARLRRFGLLTVADAATRAAQGEISPMQAARTVVTPSVAAETAADLAANRNLLWNGRRIYNPYGSSKEIAQQVGTRLAESVSPAQLAMRAEESPDSLKQTLYSLVGVTFPKRGALRLAAELRSEHIPDNAETPGERKKALLRSRARYLAWQGDNSGLAAARKSGLFTDREMAQLTLQTKQDPLLFEAKGLDIKDLLTLYEARVTTPAEREKLVPLLVRKAPGIQKAPPDERDDLRKRLIAAIGPQ